MAASRALVRSNSGDLAISGLEVERAAILNQMVQKGKGFFAVSGHAGNIGKALRD